VFVLADELSDGSTPSHSGAFSLVDAAELVVLAAEEHRP
jgi:hypothetical protein